MRFTIILLHGMMSILIDMASCIENTRSAVCEDKEEWYDDTD